MKHLLVALGLRIEENRKIQKLTQIEFAEKCNIARNYLSTIESGKANPSLAVLFTISDQLGVPLCKLLQEDKSAYCYSASVKQQDPPLQTWIYVPSKKSKI